MSLFFNLRCLDVCKLSLKIHYSTYTSVKGGAILMAARWRRHRMTLTLNSWVDKVYKWRSSILIHLRVLKMLSEMLSEYQWCNVEMTYLKKKVPMLVLSTSLYIDQHQIDGLLYIVNWCRKLVRRRTQYKCSRCSACDMYGVSASACGCYVEFIHSAYTVRMLQPIWIDDTQNMWK